MNKNSLIILETFSVHLFSIPLPQVDFCFSAFFQHFIIWVSSGSEMFVQSVVGIRLVFRPHPRTSGIVLGRLKICFSSCLICEHAHVC